MNPRNQILKPPFHFQFDRHMTPRAEVTENTMLDDLRHGWQVFKSFRWIVVIVISFSFIVMCWAAAESVLGPLIALEHFNGPKSW